MKCLIHAIHAIRANGAKVPEPGPSGTKQLRLLGVALMLGGCVTTSDVTAMGRNTFMVSTDARGGFTSSAILTARSAQKANAYCAALGREMVPDSVQSQGVRGFTPQENTFIFRCLASDDPGNRPPELRPAPNSVIELRR